MKKIITQGEKRSLGGQVGVPKILVIDDDPIFLAQMVRSAKQKNLSLSTCASVQELNSLLASQTFDAAILDHFLDDNVDYFLDELKTHDKGTEVISLLDGTPTIIVSSTEQVLVSKTSPASVRKFMHKKAGVDALLDAAIQLKEENKALRNCK